MNNFRLSTNTNLIDAKNVLNLDLEITKVFSLQAPYEIKNGVRLLAGTNKWVPSSTKIIAIDNLGNEIYFDSISQCSLTLKISKSQIKDCIITGTGKLYKNFTFKLNLNYCK
jgi:hypothetical protein